VDPPYDYFGGPLHAAFWRFFEGGMAPAQALFAAKVEYLLDVPHGDPDVGTQAIENKLWRQYTCLGLGW
jgi:hypothetical protein